MALPRVSIVTPSFQQAQYLEQTIRSVLEQGYPNLEYWVMDGGSRDGSVDIIGKYADRLAGWVSERDSGQAEAINKGFARATGEIIAWVNSDDYYLPGAIQAAVAALEQHPEAAMVYGDVVSINGEGETINIQTFRPLSLEHLMQFNIIGQPSVFMRRSALEKAGYLDLGYHFMLDHQLWLRVAQHGTMVYVPQRWSAARYHAAAKNIALGPKFGLEAFRVVEWMEHDPALAPIFHRQRRKVMAGVYRYNGHYLLDAGSYRPALAAYLRSLGYYPPIALPDMKRILYAAASTLVNLESIKRAYLERRKNRLRKAGPGE